MFTQRGTMRSSGSVPRNAVSTVNAGWGAASETAGLIRHRRPAEQPGLSATGEPLTEASNKEDPIADCPARTASPPMFENAERFQMCSGRPKAASTLSCIISLSVGCGNTVSISSASVSSP